MLRLITLIVSMAALAAAQGPLRFELKRLEKRPAGCTLVFEYPEIISAETPQARDRINAGILRVLLRRNDWPAPDSGFPSLNAYADNFIKFCGEFQKRAEGRALYAYKLVTIFRYTPPILSFRCEASEDGGGVHPFGTTFYVNFESSTGKAIALTDLVKDGALAKLEAVAEATFQRDHNLSRTGSLSEPYSFPGGRFKLNENFGIGEKELVFLFNTYEIGPGAMGATEISIPYRQVSNLLKIDSGPW